MTLDKYVESHYDRNNYFKFMDDYLRSIIYFDDEARGYVLGTTYFARSIGMLTDEETSKIEFMVDTGFIFEIKD